MGMPPFSKSSDSLSFFIKKSDVTKPNPNPYRYSIKLVCHTRNYVIVKVNYPDCTTYGGDKFLVYHTDTYYKTIESDKMDPHFLENEFSPIARFTGDLDGFKNARLFTEALNKGNK